MQVPWRIHNRDHVKDCPQKPRCSDKVTSPVKAGSCDTLIAEVLWGNQKNQSTAWQANCFCQVKVGLNLHPLSRWLCTTQHIWKPTTARIWWKAWIYLFTYFKRRQFAVEKPFGSCTQFLVTGYLPMQISGAEFPQALCRHSSGKSGHQQVQLQASCWSTASLLSGKSFKYAYPQTSTVSGNTIWDTMVP